MQHSLRVRIFLMVFVAVVVAVAVVWFFANRGALLAMRGLAAVSAERDQLMAAELLQPAGVTADLTAVQVRAEQVAKAMDARILVFDQRGVVLVDSFNQQVGELVRPPGAADGPLPAQPLYLANEQAFLTINYTPASGAVAAMAPSERQILRGTFGLATPGRLIGTQAPADVLWTLPAQAALNQLNRLLGLAALAGSGAALALTAVLSRRVVGPVEALTAAARRMERGDLSQRVRVSAKDEIGELARAFNAMADSVSVSETLRRQMVSDIAHELRTPLTNIRGYLEALRDGLLEPCPEVVESLYEESLLLNRLVDDLQDLALAEAGQLRLNRQPTQVAEVAERTLAALHPLAGTGPAVRLAMPPGLPLVDADPERVGQVLRNLIGNARHYTPPEGEITVSAEAVPGAVAVTVRDNGCGIAPEHLPYVFERFYRADQARARATGGAGLGLAIVKQLVEAHGGHISLESTMGEGTRVTFTLPVAA